jgi:hypothetical protein
MFPRSGSLGTPISRLASRLNFQMTEGNTSVVNKIEVGKIDQTHFRVQVTEGRSESTHDVTLDPKDYSKLASRAVTPEELIRKSFEFLLEREPKESILDRFDLSVISRYFPEYEREIRKRLL